MEAEMDHHLGYEPYERSDNTNARNGRKSKMSGVNTESSASMSHRIETVLLSLK
jgi:transposase-like protein